MNEKFRIEKASFGYRLFHIKYDDVLDYGTEVFSGSLAEINAWLELKEKGFEV